MDIDSEEFIAALRVIEQFASEFLEHNDDEFFMLKSLDKGAVIIQAVRRQPDPRMN